MRLPYRLLPHTGDIRVKVIGRTPRRLLQNCVFMLMDQICEARLVKGRLARRVVVKGNGCEELLVRLLQEVLFFFDAKRFVSRRLEILKLDEGRLEGRLWGERFLGERHRFKTEIKAVTYHQLKVRRIKGDWEAKIVLDV
jgi:SHS2 domain-containing protein